SPPAWRGAPRARRARRAESAVLRHRAARETIWSYALFLRARRVAEVGVEEQLLERQGLRDEALLVRVLLDRLEILPVRFTQAVGPGIGPERLALLFPRGAHPRERHHARVRRALVRELLRLLERLHEVGRDPGVRIDDLALDRGDVHDRKDP